MKPAVRSVLYSVHTWGGLTIGLLIAILGLTGSALVFRADIEKWQVREWLSVMPVGQRLTLDQIVANGAAQIPAKEVVRVVLPHDDASSVEVILQKRQPKNLKDAELVSVFVDPYRGQVLGERERAKGWIWQLQDFHYALFAGETGLKLNGVGAAVMVALGLTGPLLWWPGWRRRRDALRVRRRPKPAFWRDLHALSGVAICIALLLIGLTGLYYAYRTTATAVIALASGTSGVPAPIVDSAGEPPVAASLTALVAAASRAVPEATLDELRPSRRAGSPAILSFRLPDDVVFGRHRMFLNPRDATVLRIDRHDSLPLGARMLGNMAPWHFGSFGGRLTQWLWFIAGLLPAGLFASGLWLWLRKRRPTTAHQPAASTAN
ncbi:MAG TPA: PepSY-associated TM helix domain-containing protein [Steroidobacteraceae bacterium]|nr:PepSY-associated TM helix domain-containing protein [Steroidobacteraceae bacterium]